MRLDDLLKMSVRQVLRQRWRNLGVLLAIALGTAGFIVVITMGENVKNGINQDLETLGGITLIRVVFDEPRGKYSLSMHQWFRESTVSALRDLPGVQEVTLTIDKWSPAKVIMGGRRYSVNVLGVDEFFWEVNSLSAKKGSFFGPEDVARRRKVCVLGEGVAKKIFGHTDVVGLLMPIDVDVYNIIGLISDLDTRVWSYRVILPITTAQDRIKGLIFPRAVYVRCRTWDDVEGVAKRIPQVIRTYQPVTGLQVKVKRGALKRVKRVAWGIELFVSLAVCATLVLGGFGIWNIMMSGVRARTREIGLKKAMGAEDRDILAQFLAEALCLSFGAALLGVGLGRIGVELLASALGSQPPEDLFLLCVGLGLLFSILLGIGAGLWPSIRASRMEVVSAVRFE